MKTWKKGFEIGLLACGLMACLQSFSPAKIERNKVIKKDFDAKERIVADHYYGPLTIKKSTDGRIHLEAEMLLEGTDQAGMEEVLSRFDIDVDDAGNQLRVATRLGIESCNTVNDNMTIKYKDGHKVKGLSKMMVKMTLYVANPQSLTLSNQYDRIELADDYNGLLTVKLYSGELVAANLGGSVNLDLKYSKARLQNLGRAKLVIYDSEVKTGNVQEAEVSSRYSEFVVGQVARDLKLQTYDEQWEVGSVGGRLTLDDKYSEFKFADIHEADMMMFDAAFSAEKVGDMDIRNTKYSKYKFSAVGRLDINISFDDEFGIQAAETVVVKDSKYTEYRVGRLTNHFTLGQSFDDAVRLDEVAAGFSNIGFDGKYTDLELAIDEAAQFQFSVNMQYGKVDFPESRVDLRKHEEKDDRILIQGFVGADKMTPESFLKISGFDNTVVWN